MLLAAALDAQRRERFCRGIRIAAARVV